KAAGRFARSLGVSVGNVLLVDWSARARAIQPAKNVKSAAATAAGYSTEGKSGPTFGLSSPR
ncbi:MAG TPA: hypothetical protein VFQ80_13370, partial [Thermomicrobiales bacterium]|nr:hypothetical protein [Thermomicrobiales bacterium]